MEHKFNADDLFLLEEDTNSTFPLNLEFRKNPHFQINFILKNLFFIITLLISVSSFGQECPTFSFKETLSGNDFVNFNWNPTLKVCEDDKTIEIGSETYYYSRSTRNAYGDFVYIIQEARGYGWPEIGYVKIASNFEIVELKFMNSIVKYRLISTIEKARIDREEQIEREKRQRQQQEERRKIEEERLKIENQKKDADKVTIENINQFLNKNALEDLVNEYGKLNFENSAIKSSIQNKLEEKYGNEIIILNFYNVEDYLKSNKTRIKSLNPGKYSISFDKLGNPSNINFPNWPNVPNKEFGSFSVKLNSQTEIEVLVKDSILVSSTYSTSNEKPLYIDKNEKFYFKTKTGLPVTTTSYNQAVDKKLVRINKVYKREKYANGILIDSQEFKTEKTVGILKKDQ